MSSDLCEVSGNFNIFRRTFFGSIRYDIHYLMSDITRGYLIVDRNIFNKAPVTTGADLDIVDTFIRDHHVRRIP